MASIKDISQATYSTSVVVENLGTKVECASTPILSLI